MPIPLGALAAGAGRALLGGGVRLLAGGGVRGVLGSGIQSGIVAGMRGLQAFAAKADWTGAMSTGAASALHKWAGGHASDPSEMMQKLRDGASSLNDQFKKLAIGTENLAQHFARVSPHLMVIFRLAQVQQMLRERRIGQDIAPAVRGAVQARQRREDVFAPLVVEQQKMRAHLSELVDSLVTKFKPIIDFGAWALRVLDDFLEMVKRKLGLEAKDKGPVVQQPWGQFWQDMAAGELKRKRDRELGKRN